MPFKVFNTGLEAQNVHYVRYCGSIDPFTFSFWRRIWRRYFRQIFRFSHQNFGVGNFQPSPRILTEKPEILTEKPEISPPDSPSDLKGKVSNRTHRAGEPRKPSSHTPPDYSQRHISLCRAGGNRCLGLASRIGTTAYSCW